MSSERAALRWWDTPDALERVLADLLCAELRRLRPGGPAPPPAWQWRPDTRLDADGTVGADSLELLALSAAAAELIETPDADLLSEPTLGGWCASLRHHRRDAPVARMPFRTSGSTGAPTRHLHGLDALDAEAACLARIVAHPVPGISGPRRRVLSAVPFHHAYGFIHGVLLPRTLGAPGAALPVVDLRPCSPAAVAARLRPGDLVLGHPTWWEAVATATAPGAVPGDVVGVTSTSPCPAELALAVLSSGLARLVQVYGSTETAGIAWRDGPSADFALLPVWRRDGEDLRRDGDGAAIALPDVVEWRGDTEFRILGRRDGAVQVGGANVYPSRVRAVLTQHPAVADAAVRAAPLAQGGRLKAFIVPNPEAPDAEGLRAALAAHVAQRLSPAERPRSYRFGPSLPRDAMGKLTDWPIERSPS